ncbi:beta-ketoacyl synthase N-terminal-like domain-containing protein [Aliikangiella sp. IMCC44359]|uniref:beta-ketoacyl synthase N-terminal-like domain-containing protein n=1 Tax=Aliikangiella sp. IMCC44359 TaxID=3459125 RepID=UPI00403AF5B8
MNKNNKICISGIGVVSALGEQIESHHSILSQREMANQPYDFKNFKPANYIKRRYLRPLDEVTIRSICMVQAALNDSGVDTNELLSNRVGLVLGSVFAGIGCIFDFKQTCYEGKKNNYLGLSPLFFPGIVFNSVSGQPAIEFGFTGPNTVVNSGLSSGLLAIAKGAEYIRAGKADVMIAGGTEMMHPFIQRKFQLEKNSNKIKSLGSSFSLGEATCLFVLHRDDDKRFAMSNRYATIESWQYGFCPENLNSNTLKNAMHKCLKGADLESLSAIVTDSYPGSPVAKRELDSINEIVCDLAIPLLNNKKLFGHTLGASGSLNLLQSLLHLKNKKLMNENTIGKDTKNKSVLVNSIDPEGNFALMSLKSVNINE